MYSPTEGVAQMMYEPTEKEQDLINRISFDKRERDLKEYEEIAAIIDRAYADMPEDQNCLKESREWLKKETAKIYGVKK